MKKILFAFAYLYTLTAYGQLKEGGIVYAATVNLPGRGGDEAHTIKNNCELLFNSDKSLWQLAPVMDEEDPGAGGGERIVRKVPDINDIIFFNASNKQLLVQSEFMGRDFLIDEKLTPLKWKLGDDTKTLLGYTVQKATAQRTEPRVQIMMENGELKRKEVMDTATIVAWFAPSIALSYGPGKFQGQLPGLILELNINNGRYLFQATEIAPKLNAASLQEPKEGKRISSEAFAKERARLIEEMQKNNPGGGPMRVIVN